MLSMQLLHNNTQSISFVGIPCGHIWSPHKRMLFSVEILVIYVKAFIPSILYPIWLILKLNAFKYNLNEHLDNVLFTQRVLILELMEDQLAVHIIFPRTMNVKVCFIFHRRFK